MQQVLYLMSAWNVSFTVINFNKSEFSFNQITWCTLSAYVVDRDLFVLSDLFLVGHNNLAAGHHHVVATPFGFVHHLVKTIFSWNLIIVCIHMENTGETAK